MITRGTKYQFVQGMMHGRTTLSVAVVIHFRHRL